LEAWRNSFKGAYETSGGDALSGLSAIEQVNVFLICRSETNAGLSRKFAETLRCGPLFCLSALFFLTS
jgi:hypothetical protein